MVRRGLSLMEVLVSIGVASIGLMGVATLIPIAFHQAESGARNDRKAQVAKSAFREFHILGMGQTQRWFNPDWDGVPLDLGLDGLPTRNAFCIDPRWVANNRHQPGTNILKTVPDATSFESYFPPVLRGSVPLPEYALERPMMRMVSLQRSSSPLPMTPAHAEQFFLAQDDLQFELPDQQTLPPAQVPLSDVNGLPVKRYADGSFSWFATLVPEVSQSDLYRLSIVICYQRVLPTDVDGNGIFDVPLPSHPAHVQVVLPDPPPRVSNLPEPPGVAGIGVSYTGGDITLAQPVPVKPGEYVMLCRNAYNMDFQTMHRQFRWYRVIAVDENEISLHGADWDFRAAAPGGNQVLLNLQKTWLVYIPGVVAVHEKTIRVEESSLWMN